MAVKIPDKHYIGMIVERSSDGDKDVLPLAFMTPDGNDSAAAKRKGTVDDWVSRNSRQKKQPDPVVMDNIPMTGFRMLDNVVHHSRFHTGVKWRIEDPRGFELEINSSNLMFLMNETVIDQGDILETCIWARDGKDNFLIPINSDLYTDALHTTSTANKSVSLRDVKIGNNIVLQNGKVGRYLGKMTLLGCGYWDISIGESERHVLYNEKNDKNTLYCCSTLKVAEVRGGDELTKEEGLAIAMERLNAGEEFENAYRTGGVMLKGMTYNTEVIIDDIAWDLTSHRQSIFKYQDKYYATDYYNRSNTTTIPKREINSAIWLSGKSNYAPDRFSYGFNYQNVDQFDVQTILAEGAQMVRRRFKTTISNGMTFDHPT